jgi:hypothetical protein
MLSSRERSDAFSRVTNIEICMIKMYSMVFYVFYVNYVELHYMYYLVIVAE